MATFISFPPLAGMHVKHQVRTTPDPFFFLNTNFGMKTLIEFASDQILTQLLVKERAKCLRRNRSDKHHRLDKNCELDELSTRKMLSRMMPPRSTWVRPSKRKNLSKGSAGARKLAEKALSLTIKRDKEQWQKGETFRYLDELHDFFDRIRLRLSEGQLQLESPHLMPILKDKKKLEDGTWKVTCRPLSVYAKLDDKVILALTSRYLSRYFNRYLHENILSYRPARDFQGEKHHVTDFNDGILLIKAFRKEHDSERIYAADCDIKKFYDIIPHEVVRGCFRRMLDTSRLNEDGKGQVMRVLDAYLNSYNFYTNALKESQDHPAVFGKVQRKLHDYGQKNTYLIGKVDISDEEYRQRGVAQGGALSLQVANIVLNDVDNVIVNEPDNNQLFVRYCDDMILLHTNYDECCRLMDLYARSLTNHGLFYHDFEQVSESKCRPAEGELAVATTNHFWKTKSHLPYLWGKGEGNSNFYVGFLGYEIRRDGHMRLRKSNIERFDEKFVRLRYALRRYRKKHTEEEYLTHRKQVLDKMMKGVEVYTAFDLEQFKRHAQYRHLEKQRRRME